MTNTKNKTKKAKVWAYLNSGKGITLSVAQSKFNVKNLRATISDLVTNEGVAIVPSKDKRTGETRYTKAK